MSNTAIVRINDKLIPEFLIKFKPSENIAQSSNISSWSDIKQDSKEKLIILLSANLVFSSQVKIPSKNEEIIRQSIPFTIEEQLATDIDLNHFAHKKNSNQDILVSVISINILQDIVSKITEYGLSCHEIYSEVYSCPHQKGMTTLCAFSDFIIIRDDENGTTINPALLEQYLRLSKSKQQVIFSQSDLKIKIPENVIKKTIDMATLLAQTICSGGGVNLLQGQFVQNQSSQKTINPWKKLGLLSFILIGSWLFINVLQIWNLTGNINTLKESQKILLKELIPNASQTELNDPYSAVLSGLKLNKESQVNKSSKGFIQALIYVGKTLQQHPSIEIVSLRQRNTKLEVKLQASDVGALNQFQQSLEKTAYSMRVKTGTRDSNNGGFSSIITMEQL